MSRRTADAAGGEAEAQGQATMTDYGSFLASKRLIAPDAGREVPEGRLNPHLFPFQKSLTRFALRKGRSACWASTGLGKTRISLAWGEHAAERVLIVSPLAVAQQTVREGERIGIPVTYARSQEHAAASGITITNYEMIDRFNAGVFGAVAIDESSILKSQDGKTRAKLIDKFKHTPCRLALTATPAPNDREELANHAEFLGICTRAEFLANFFVNTDEGWRLKRHAQEAFYRWLASWAISVLHPRDIGFEQAGYDLPPLTVEPVYVECGYVPAGRLFALGLNGITERTQVRRDTLAVRVAKAVEIIAAEPEEAWLVWTGLNEESHRITKALQAARLGPVDEVSGSDSLDWKATALTAFAEGRVPMLVSKAGICGHGMNFQHCARMLFVGLSDSFELYFQALRRCWRFGQTRPVMAYVVLSEPERTIYENVLRKEREAGEMAQEMIRHVAGFEREELGQSERRDTYAAERPTRLPVWLR